MDTKTERQRAGGWGSRRLGIDIGRVIIDGSAHPTGDDTAFFKGGIDNALRTPAMPGAFESIARLTEIFEGRVWLVSKCGERVEARTRQWLEHHRFFERTAIDARHLRFCRQRPEKAIHCAELEITHFVDDRPDVLLALQGVVEYRYLFGPQRGAVPGDVVHCLDWDVAERAVASSQRAGEGGRSAASRRAE
jgi:hypothetical protein